MNATGKVAGRIPSLPAANPLNQGYLDTKRVRMGHLLPNS